MARKSLFSSCFAATLLLALFQQFQGKAQAVSAAPVPDAFNYVAGTQTFDPKYHFTDQPWLIETAQAILDMGSNTIKFKMEQPQRRARKNDNAPAAETYATLTERAEKDPVIKRVFAMPFANYLIWASPYSTEGRGWASAQRTPADDEKEYREIYDFTQYLLKTYNGTGKAFYLGHWEGDWLLLGSYDPKKDPAPERTQAMIRWLNVRQRAVEDARRATPHQGVAVWHYTEVNLVQKAIKGGHTLTNDVLPKTHVDYVSYSSYDSLKKEALGATLKRALDYIEAKLPPRADVPGKRVFIGEYGFPAVHNTPAQQADYTRQVIRAGLEWGCPFVLYWEVYNNEVDKDGKQRGFWLIDDKNVKQPVWFIHHNFYEKAKRTVAEFKKEHGRAPEAEEFAKAAAGMLEAAAEK